MLQFDLFFNHITPSQSQFNMHRRITYEYYPLLLTLNEYIKHCYTFPVTSYIFKKLRQEGEERITVARSRNRSCRGKARSITYSECGFVALIIRHATRMRRIILSSVACLAIPYFCTSFFFHWHYSPLWALACRTMSVHFFLSATSSLHLLTPST